MNKTISAKICRTCLSETFNYFNIFQTLYQFNISACQSELNVTDIYEQVTGNILNEIDANLPQNICFTCLEKLSNTYEFLELCKRSETELKTHVKWIALEANINPKIPTIECVNINFEDDNSLSNIQVDEGLSPSNDDDDEDGSTTDNDDLELDSSRQSTSVDGGESQNFEIPDDETQHYECSKCNETFESSAQLKQHEKIHTGNWKCTECDKILANKYSLRHHMVLHTGKPHECIVCKKRFAVLSELTRHTKIYHKNGKSYGCDQCSNRYYTKSHLTHHKLTHLNRKRNGISNSIETYNVKLDNGIVSINAGDTSSAVPATSPNNAFKYQPLDVSTAGGDLTYTHESDSAPSPIRNVLFDTSNDNLSEAKQLNFKTRNSVEGDSNAKFYRCGTCFKKFRHKKNYQSHMKLQLNCSADLNTNNNPQKCEYCDVISDNVYQLRKHLEMHLDKEPFKCTLCEKSYKTWAKFSVHTRQTHLQRTKYRKGHLCTLCGRRFLTAKILDEHYLAHQGIRKYKCDQCDRSFCTIYGLKQHATIHTRDSLQCSECGKILANKMSLKSHMTIHFGKKYQCTICEKYFPNPATLNRHMKGHRGERNYVCDRCSKRYTCRGHLNEHIKKIHENPTTFKCDECGNDFAHRRALKKHIRLEHTEKQLFNCEMCGKTYGRKSRLKEHQKKVHTLSAEDQAHANQIEGDLVISQTTYIPPSNAGVIMVEMFKING